MQHCKSNAPPLQTEEGLCHACMDVDLIDLSRRTGDLFANDTVAGASESLNATVVAVIRQWNGTRAVRSPRCHRIRAGPRSGLYDIKVRQKR